MCIQKLDENKCYTIRDIQNFVNELVVKEIITEKESNNIDINLLYKYTKSKIFEDLRKAKKYTKNKLFILIYQQQKFIIILILMIIF